MSRVLYDEYLLLKLPKAYDSYSKSINPIQAGKQLSRQLKIFKQHLHYFEYSHLPIYTKVLSAIRLIDLAVKDQVEGANHSQSNRKIRYALNTIYKAFLYELPDDHIDKYFKKKLGGIKKWQIQSTYHLIPTPMV